MLCEFDITIIFSMITILWPNITGLHIWQQVPVFISDRNKKSMKSILFVFDDELSKNNSMVGVVAKLAYPPLDGSCIWRINDKLFFLNIISGSCLKVLDI